MALLTPIDCVVLAEFLAARTFFGRHRPCPRALARFRAAERRVADLIRSDGAIELPTRTLTVVWCPESKRFRVLITRKAFHGGLCHVG